MIDLYEPHTSHLRNSTYLPTNRWSAHQQPRNKGGWTVEESIFGSFGRIFTRVCRSSQLFCSCSQLFCSWTFQEFCCRGCQLKPVWLIEYLRGCVLVIGSEFFIFRWQPMVSLVVCYEFWLSGHNSIDEITRRVLNCLFLPF